MDWRTILQNYDSRFGETLTVTYDVSFEKINSEFPIQKNPDLKVSSRVYKKTKSRSATLDGINTIKFLNIKCP